MNPNSWSTDPDSNATIDPPIQWPEGQSPGSVNNSSRAMMAAVACLLKDTTGLLTASGTNAYTIATFQSISDLSSQFEIAFFVANTNTGPATLSVNGTPARPLMRRHGRQLGPGDLVPAVLYRAIYVGGLGGYTIVSPEIAAPGTIRLQAGSSVDPGWLPCDGRAVSRSDYAELLSAIGYAFGGGDNTTTFNIPDMRGRAPFGVDGNTNRLTGAGGLAGGLGNSGGSETVAITSAQMPSHSHTGTAQSGGATDGGTTSPAGGHDHSGQTSPAGGHSHPLTIDNGGSHSHDGAASQAGGEPRAFSFTTGNANIGAAGQAFPFVADISVDGTFPNSRSTSPQAGHTHPVSIPSGGPHSHTGSIGNIADHAHPIVSVGDHVHTLPGAAAHTHPLAIDATGQGQGHPTIPPGLVVQFVIKT